MTREQILDMLREDGFEGHILALCADAVTPMFRVMKGVPKPYQYAEIIEAVHNAPSRPEVALLRPILRGKFKVDEPLLETVMAGMDKTLRAYALSYGFPVFFEDITQSIEHLDKMARAATRLKGLLPRVGSPMIGLLDLVSLGKPEEDQVSVETDFEELDFALERLIRAKETLYASEIGKIFGLGRASAKGNLALKLWMKSLHDIWTLTLSRNLTYDGKNGVNGRKRFLEFCYETLIEFDPRIEMHSMENLLRKSPNCNFFGVELQQKTSPALQ